MICCVRHGNLRIYHLCEELPSSQVSFEKVRGQVQGKDFLPRTSRLSSSVWEISAPPPVLNYGSAFGEIINHLALSDFWATFSPALGFDKDYSALTMGRAKAGKRGYWEKPLHSPSEVLEFGEEEGH